MQRPAASKSRSLKRDHFHPKSHKSHTSTRAREIFSGLFSADSPPLIRMGITESQGGGICSSSSRNGLGIYARRFRRIPTPLRARGKFLRMDTLHEVCSPVRKGNSSRERGAAPAPVPGPTIPRRLPQGPLKPTFDGEPVTTDGRSERTGTTAGPPIGQPHVS